MGYHPRRLEKFTSSDGSTTVATFPLYAFDQESTQPLRTPEERVAGAHYGFDLLGTAPGLKDDGNERLRAEVWAATPAAVDTAVGDLRSKCHRIGLGKLWAVDSAGVRRWSWARLREMIPIKWSAGDTFRVGVALDFRRQSDWYAESLTSSTAAASGTVVINNPGTAKVYTAVITLYGTYTNPVITNTTTGYICQTNRDGTSANHRVRFNAETGEILYASDGGTVWSDDYANYVRPSTQVHIMVLNPGNNSFTFSGVTSATIAWSFYAAYD
jgi:hypothetical protein